MFHCIKGFAEENCFASWWRARCLC